MWISRNKLEALEKRVTHLESLAHPETPMVRVPLEDSGANSLELLCQGSYYYGRDMRRDSLRRIGYKDVNEVLSDIIAALGITRTRGKTIPDVINVPKAKK